MQSYDGSNGTKWIGLGAARLDLALTIDHHIEIVRSAEGTADGTEEDTSSVGSNEEDSQEEEWALAEAAEEDYRMSNHLERSFRAIRRVMIQLEEAGPSVTYFYHKPRSGYVREITSHNVDAKQLHSSKAHNHFINHLNTLQQ